MEQLSPLIQGAWDIHVHAAPSLFPRCSDAWDLANCCRSYEMKGLVLKCHQGSSVETAAMLQRSFPDLAIYGGVTLNHYVGGINPYAVDACIQLGGKIVWLPTIHSCHHGQTMGCLGGFHFQNTRDRKVAKTGLSIFDHRQRLTAEIKEIVALLAGQNVVLASGHLAPAEIFALQKYIIQECLDVPLLLNHVLFTIPDLTIAQLQQLVHPGTWFEIVYFSISSLGPSSTGQAIAAAIKAIPHANWIMASDSGQPQNPPAPVALNHLIRESLQSGVLEAQLRNMLHDQAFALFRQSNPA